MATQGPILRDSEGREKIHLENLRQTHICDVWKENFAEQLQLISELIDEYNVIAMDTEFPGIKQFKSDADDDKEMEYQQIKKNVQSSKIIQIGISIASEDGYVPVSCNTWQFNFKFEKTVDTIRPDVLQMLEKAGINFEVLGQRGIDPNDFIDRIFDSGLILNDDLKWIVFHGGFDFGYLIQMFHHMGVPNKSDEFSDLMKHYFPQTFDLKYSLKESHLKDIGLSKLAQRIKVDRIGPEHQAGSDSLLTLSCYFKLKKNPQYTIEANQIERQKNIIYGIGKGFIPNNKWKSYDNTMIQQDQLFENTQEFYPQQIYQGYGNQFDQYLTYEQQQQYNSYYQNYTQPQQGFYYFNQPMPEDMLSKKKTY